MKPIAFKNDEARITVHALQVLREQFVPLLESEDYKDDPDRMLWELYVEVIDGVMKKMGEAARRDPIVWQRFEDTIIEDGEDVDEFDVSWEDWEEYFQNFR